MMLSYDIYDVEIVPFSCLRLRHISVQNQPKLNATFDIQTAGHELINSSTVSVAIGT